MSESDSESLWSPYRYLLGVLIWTTIFGLVWLYHTGFF